MPNEKPVFDHNKPFEPAGGNIALGDEPKTKEKPPFDPNKPFQPAETQGREDPYFTQLNQSNSQDNIFRMVDSLPEMPGDTQSKKQIIKDLIKNGGTADEVTQTMEVLRGKHKAQNGSTKYYMDERGVAHPLANNQKAPEGYRIASLFGSEQDAKDDSFITDLAKTAWNILPSAAKGLVGLAQTGYEAVMDESSENLQSLENAAESLKFEKDPDIQGSLFNPEGMTSYTDVLEGKRWDLSPQTIWGNALALGQSVGEFMIPASAAGKLAKGAKWATKTEQVVDKATGTVKTVKKLTTAGKVATAGVASFIVNHNEVRDAAEAAGLEGRDIAKFSLPIALAVATIDVKLGLGSKIFQNSVEKEAKDAFILEAAKKTLGKTVDGKLTKEALDEAVKETITSYPKLARTWAKEVFKDANEQGIEEGAQAFIQNAGQQIWDNISDEEKAKFGTKTFSPESLGEYLQNYLAGTIGGAPTAVAFNKVKQIERENNQSKTVFGVVQKGDEAIKTFKQNVQAAKENGELTDQEAQDAITRVNSYKEYNDIASSLKMPDEQKRESFDLTFQKQNLETQIEAMGDPKKMNPLDLAQYDGLVKQSTDLQKRINEIVFKNQIKEEKVATEKSVKDATKDEQPPKENEKKTKLSPEMQAMADKYKSTVATKVEDKRTYEETPVEEFNDKKTNFRVKHKKLTEWLWDKTTNTSKVVVGKLQKDPYTSDNNTYMAELPDGKQVRFSSSMVRNTADKTGGFRGHFRQERFPEYTDETIIGVPLAVKAVEIPALGKDSEVKKAVKIFRPDNGKFVGWGKATNTGTSKAEYTQEQSDFLEDEQIRDEPVQGESEEITPTQPVSPKTPITDVMARKGEDARQAKKPVVKVEMVSAKSLVDAKNPIAAKKKHDKVKSKIKGLKQLIDCVWS